MNNEQFKIYLDKIEKNINNIDFKEETKKSLLKFIKNSFQKSKNNNLSSDSFSIAKMEIDRLIKKEKKMKYKENYLYFIIEIGLIFFKNPQLTIFEISKLKEYENRINTSFLNYPVDKSQI